MAEGGGRGVVKSSKSRCISKWGLGHGGGGAQVFEGIFARNFMKRHALFWE